MEKEMVSPFDAMRPAIKLRWAALLRGGSLRPRTRTGLVTPEMLVLMIDHTLNRLAGEISSPPTWAGRPKVPAPTATRSASCQCGIDLLVGYYLAGARAVHEVLPADFGPSRMKLVHLLNRIAHDEIEALCGVCQNWSGSRCKLNPDCDPAYTEVSACSTPHLRAISSE